MGIILGPKLTASPKMIWANVIKALLAEVWFEKNQRFFHDKSFAWMNASSSWCYRSKLF